MLYRVTWAIVVESSGPREAVRWVAAQCFADHIRDGEPECATEFKVTDTSGNTEIIDIVRL